MDYLDPAKKRAHRIRLFVGYALFAVAIAFATLILVYLANGFYVDRSTGKVIQNGLVFVDSNPNGADVYLNGEKQSSKTDARLVIPGGSYDIAVKKTGYRDWERSLTLEEGSLRRLTYARLIPEKLETSEGSTLRSQPVHSSQSINKKWLVLSHQDSPLNLTLIDVDQNTIVAQPLIIPETLVINPAGTLEIVEWANDNKFMLGEYTTSVGVEYLLIDRSNPAQSINLNTAFNVQNVVMSLQDRGSNKFYLFDPVTKLLYTATLQNGLQKKPVTAAPLLAYTTFGDDWLLYVTESGDSGLVNVRFKRGDKDILLKQLKTDTSYLLELAKLGSAPIMAISSPIESRAIVYNDPQKFLNENSGARIPVATTVLRVPAINGITISSDSSVILAYGPDNFASHEFDADRSYNFSLEESIDLEQEPRWMDGQHLLLRSGGKQQMIDFDGSNRYELVSSIPILGSYFTNSIETMYSFTPAVAATAGEPAVPARISTTSLLIPADQ